MLGFRLQQSAVLATNLLFEALRACSRLGTIVTSMLALCNDAANVTWPHVAQMCMNPMTNSQSEHRRHTEQIM